MRPIILTAGQATRAGGYAPYGCKALVDLGGRPIIDWQLDVLGENPIIVCRSEHRGALAGYGEVITNDNGSGSADALSSALASPDGLRDDIVVAYADTYFSALPDGSDWVGTSDAKGGRRWDVIRDGQVAYEHVAEGWTAKVCVGLYAFADPERLKFLLDRLLLRRIFTDPEMGLAPVLNDYQPWRDVTIASWQDVGSVPAIQAWAWQD